MNLVEGIEEPSRRMGQAMIYDPVNKRVLMFGGSVYTNNYAFYDELWSFETVTSSWTLVETGVKPSGRFHHSMVYVPDRHQILLFGGWSTSDKIGDTWVYDIASNSWLELHPADHPSPRSSAAMTYDEENKVVVLFGGVNGDTHTDVWVYDFNLENWVCMNPSSHPLPQYGSGMVYDSVNNKILLYPGHWSTSRTVHGFGDKVWVYDYIENTWTELDTSPRPTGRYWFHYTWVAHEAAFLLNSGTGSSDEPCSEVWLYRYEDNSWQMISTEEAPITRSSSSMCYDPDTRIIVLFGGADVNVRQLGDTWLLDSETWTWTSLDDVSQITSTDSPVTVDTDTRTGIPGFPAPALIMGLVSLVYVYWIKRSESR
ncbi:MAG: hypothetical protein NWE89_03920 [Candidatus Bathyarchaeota archaeon]|nr:hypothetical protein [Candidatus Bathyarchaeota archaeon]